MRGGVAPQHALQRDDEQGCDAWLSYDDVSFCVEQVLCDDGLLSSFVLFFFVPLYYLWLFFWTLL